MTDKEQRAHDLALFYNLAFNLCENDTPTPQGFIANYKQDYEEFLKMLDD